MSVDWTLSASNILTYLGVVIVLAWRIGHKLSRFEETLAMHARTLSDHGKALTNHDERFNRAMERVGGLAEQLQRLIGRTEIHFDRREQAREP